MTAQTHTAATSVARPNLWDRWVNIIGEAQFAAAFFVVLLVINIILNPARFHPGNLGVVIGLAAPYILAAIASTPAILSGRGGIDISVGPLMGLVNVVMVQYMIMNWGIESPFVIIPVILIIGALSGSINGFLAAVLHIQPIVATLGTYLIYTGVTLWLMPSPAGDVPDWLASMSGATAAVPIIVVCLAWWLMMRNPFYEHLMATGGDDRAAYASGVPITAVRMVAYIITGLFAAIAGLSLTALLGSADPTVGPNYTLTAIAGVALGGVSLAGGKGTIIGALLGAVDIFLLQSIITFFNVSPFVLQIAYGAILVLAVALNSAPVRGWLRQIGGRHGSL